MNVIVVGLGSMGRRRIRLIKQYNEKYKIIGIDLNEERRKQSEEEFSIETSANLTEILTKHKIDCAFISTSPLSHSKIINICLTHNVNVFTELNLVKDGYDENINLAKANNLCLFLSSTFLYRAEIKEINALVEKQEKKLNYTYHVGQYLPDWHPWENIKDFFVGDKRTNGCREIFAIELPWLTHTFGEVSNFKVVKNKISSLDLDYNDSYLVIIEHITGHKGILSVDVVSRKGVRNLEIVGEDVYLTWDGSANGLKVLNLENNTLENIELYDEVVQLSEYNKFIVENAYFEEVKTFFGNLGNSKSVIYDFEKDKKILDLIDEIEA